MAFLRNSTIRLSLLVLALGTQLFAQRSREIYNGREVVGNEVVIRLKDASSPGLLNLLGAMLPADSLQILNEELGLVLVHSPTRPVGALLDLFANRGDLYYVEPNFTVQALATPNDAYLGQLWGMQKTGATLAWDISRGNQSSVVGIIDTGINYNHPDLAANIWSAPTAFTVKVGAMQISCPAGSHGLNAISMTCDPADDNGHGTHVAGTVGAVGNNGVGVAGMNWTASMMALKFLDSTGSGSVSNAIRAINFSIQVKRYFAGTATPVNVRVLSNSWSGSGYSQGLLDAINNAGANNMLFVAAAGNAAANDDVTRAYPASYGAANLVTVAATDSSDNLASFSSYGATTVHLAAPGVGILSTYGSDYATLSGTSMATPHVAGAAALVLSGCPDLNTAALKDLLLKNVDALPVLSGKTVSGGRLNVNNSLQACNASRQPTVSSVTVNPSTLQSGQTASIIVSLTGAAAAPGVTVSLSSSDPASVNIPASVTIPQGSSSATLSFTAGTVTSSTPFTITASAYSVSKTVSGTVTPKTVSVSVKMNSANQSLIVDGTAYTSEQVFQWTSGSSHSISASPQSPSAGTQFVWLSWSDGGAQTHTIAPTTDVEFTANFKTQYLLSAAMTPAGAGSIAATPASTSGYYDAGSTVQLSVLPNSGYTFQNWAGDLAGSLPSQTVTMSGPRSVTAALLKIVNVSVKTSPANQWLVVDGTAYSSAHVFQWTSGSSHSISSSAQDPGPGTQFVWLGWSDGGAITHTIAPTTDVEFTASFQTQYLLSTAVTPAGAGSITATPASASGYYDAGSTVQLSVLPNSGYTLLNWAGDLAGSLLSQTITMSGPRSVTAALLLPAPVITLPDPVVTPPDPVVTPPPSQVVTPPPTSTQPVTTPPAVVPSSSFVTAYDLSGQPLRNDYSGWVGMKITVGAGAMQVTSLGRLCVAGNGGIHTVKFVNATNGADVPGGSISVNMTSCSGGQFQFATLPSSITLPAGASYYLVSQELQGGDRWYDVGQIATNSEAAVNSAIFSPNGATWTSYGGPNNSYIPPSFQYTVTETPIGSPLVTSFNNSMPLRNDYSGWVGMKFTVGVNPMSVSSLGRICVAGNSGVHTVKLVNATTGGAIAGGSAQVNMTGCTPGQFTYAALSSSITLQAKTAYYLVSQEVYAGDRWYDYGTISTNPSATVNGPVYTLLGFWIPVSAPSMSYGPVNLK